MQKGALPGFRDFYPEDLALRAHIFSVWRQVATRYGFEEYDGPPLESLELYTAKSGDEIVGQLYNFTDKGDRAVALRPEMTPTLARMVAARANGLKKPIRWFSLPQLFRYERQQRGRLREHFQLNCDLIGEAGPLADAEVIALAVDVMRGFGLTKDDVRVRLSDRRIVQALLKQYGVGEGALGVAFQVLDRFEKSKPDDLAARLVAAGLSSAQADKVLGIPSLDGLEAVLSELGNPVHVLLADPLKRVLHNLEVMGLGGFVDIDLTIVRGLAYYTGTVFELFDARHELRAICGGGRYDSLTGAIGGVDLPAVGFGMGDVVLGELLKDRGLLPGVSGSIDVYLAAATDFEQDQLLGLAHKLRDEDVRVEFALGGQSASKQQDMAKARNARLLVTLGGDVMTVKDLQAKTQHTVPSATAVKAIAALIQAK